MKDADILKRIREIVERWKDDTWTDGVSYDSMIEISDLLAKNEQEPRICERIHINDDHFDWCELPSCGYGFANGTKAELLTELRGKDGGMI